MPEISRFYGITIKMYFGDHPPPHFHAEYGEHEAVLSIETLAVVGGSLPPRAMSLVSEWASLHRDDLLVAWRSAEALAPIGKIDPLR